MSKHLGVYLKTPPNYKAIEADYANVVDGFLHVIPTDPQEPDYTFNLDNVIYWTSKEIL